MSLFINSHLQLIVLLIGLATLIGIILLILGIFKISNSDIVRKRMQVFITDTVTVNPNRPRSYRMTPRNLSGSFFYRIFIPFSQKFLSFFGKLTPSNSINKLDYNLRQAGNPFGFRAREFYGIRMITLFLGFGVAFITYSYSGLPSLSALLIGLLIIYLSFVLPGVWLNQRINQRKAELDFDLPNLLDMLSVCAVAGLSFDQSLKKICDFWPTPLSEEFKQVLQEIDMGISRAEALRNLKIRANIDSLSSFIAIMIQAEATGMNYADVLETEAKQMRIFRQYRAKEQANALQAKLMVPVSIFIFPAIILIIIGPLLPTLMGGMFK